MLEEWKKERKWKSLSCVRLLAIPWTIQSMEFSRPEYWSGQLFPSSGDLPNPGIKSRSPTLQADSLPAEPRMLEWWPIPSPGDLPDPGIEPGSPALQANGYRYLTETSRILPEFHILFFPLTHHFCPPSLSPLLKSNYHVCLGVSGTNFRHGLLGNNLPLWTIYLSSTLYLN